MRLFSFTMLFILSTLCTGCASRKYKDVTYLNPEAKAVHHPKLNVFVPRGKKQSALPVLIFVHGGNWNSGSKDTYGFFGRNFAKKGIVTIIPDYTLSPDANFDGMAREIAAVIQWAKAHVAQYGGDPGRIFITGHSAGGHLAALAVMNPKYGINPADLSGMILNDAAGLDMKHYLEQNPPTSAADYLATWTDDPNIWQQASPVYYIDKNTPPIMMYTGDKTYESIKVSNQRFLAVLKPFQDVEPIVLHKKHIPMVLQYFWPWSPRFDEIAAFMQGKPGRNAAKKK